MGDYAKNGEKIGTCGDAYYATLPMLKKHENTGDEEVNHYLKPENKCSFAFPFPAYDGKEIGEISNFHEGQREDFFFDYTGKEETHHSQITFHLHPKGGAGKNFFAPCIHSKNAIAYTQAKDKIFTYSGSPVETVTFRLTKQSYFEGKLCVVAECVYCGCDNIFDKQEAEEICNWILSRKHTKLIHDAQYGTKTVEDLEKKSYYAEIAKRIIETYN